MRIIKKYTAIEITTKNVDDEILVKLKYGHITGPYYSRDTPEEEFDTEEEAIHHAHKTNEWGRCLIVPVVRFDNF